MISVTCGLLLLIAFLSRDESSIAKKRRQWMADRYDINPALRRRP